MPNRDVLTTCALALCAMTLASCDVIANGAAGRTAQDVTDSTPEGVVRKYRYVVEVDTPKEIVEGHAVNGWHTTCHHGLNGRTCDTAEQSEAAVVDLPDGRRLYALLTDHGQVQFVCCYHAYAMKQQPKPSTAYAEFLPGHYPDLIMFDDERDPKSVRFVDGTKPFDKGYRIRRIYLASTEMPLTHEILHRLPWLPSVDGNLAGLPNGHVTGIEASFYGKSSFMEPANVQPS